MIDIFNQNIAFPQIDRELASSWISQIIRLHDKEEGDLVFVFCSDQYLLEINREYLHHDYFTDIITFNYNQENVVSGDIFISLDTVGVNAEEYQVSFLNELHRVMIHGILHLIGFDDKTDDQKKIMREKENDALNIFHF